MPYQPIENYGIIGDLNTVALVGLNGSIDFMCFPNFDSPSIFAALLDAEKGGSFLIEPLFKERKTKQLYLPETNVLLTRFLSAEGVGEITDFMPVEELFSGKELVRRVTTIRGEVKYQMQCRPRFNYGRSEHTVERVSENEVLFSCQEGGSIVLRLLSSVPLQVTGTDVVAEFTLGPTQTADFILEHVGQEHPKGEDFEAFVTKSLFETVNYWQNWVSQSTYTGRWRDTVNRSALVLKLLISHQHGSIVASPTFSLPESIGGGRNFDYRFTWIRDASFSMYALIRLGYTKEAGHFMHWVEAVCQDIKGQDRLGIMYSLDGHRQLEEKELDHFEGYKQSSPVRIGNDAYGQLQLDIYGELMDSVYLSDKYGDPISYDFWKSLEKHLDWLTLNWNQPDEGIWEVRGGRKNFLYSRLLCWVAFDRAIRIGTSRSFPLKEEWRTQRDKIFNSIFTDFWDEEKQAFMQYPGAQTVDAATLLMPLVRFISPKDPRWLSTLKRIEEELVSDSLVYRYRQDLAAPDGFVSHEGTFSMCSFWYVECLSRSGQVEKARFYFEKMLGYANHLGLYAEQLGFQGEHLGNFPQAFTHLGLISAAYNLDRQLNKRNA
ncbi:glycoside hydrolase family 15 protein [Rufibacter glacialis]|uniref:Glycoside hydrolase family 15 protein n=1 Tax=Rufibacter glacialis TaxID=1259555 RepID=A0A5M8QDH2_9BACT|nr:glycoside hydrolase family 15 protein [Rufibacter glacialis]KAA6433228.1 glycoside hydrolase family 15 protein [Rufibacter glacialis]GGK76302.1 glucoamylase [Rufibacter glacialis]